MKFTSLLGASLLATSTFAIPLNSRLSNRLAARHTQRQSNRPEKHQKNTTVSTLEDGTYDTTLGYSSNWAGAVFSAPPSSDGATFTAISAQFTVPDISLPSNAEFGTTYSASIWVGIDGDTYGAAILQAGINLQIDPYGDISFSPWYEWYPTAQITYSDPLPMNPGDVIQVDIVVTSSTSGTATVSDLTTGGSVSSDVYAPSDSNALVGQNAEWIVEDYSVGGGLVPLCDWGSVTFTNSVATLSDGSQVGVDGTDTLEIEQNDVVLASVTAGGSDVTVTYQS